MHHHVSDTERLLSRAASFREGAWEPAVRRRTELCLLDSLASFSAGITLNHFTPFAAIARDLFGLRSNGASLPARPTAFTTAYLYGAAANLLDYDEMLSGHPGASVVGAVLSVAADNNLGIDRVLRGIAAGYEMHWLLATASAPTSERGAFVRSIGVFDTIAAATGIGISLALDDEVLERTIGVAVEHSLLPFTAKWYDRPVPSLKNNLGWVGSGAVLAASLAQAGKSGVTAPLEGPTGLWRMAGSDQWQLDEALFDRPAVLRVGFKRFPACWHLQEYLRTFSDMIETLAQGDTIREIVIRGPASIERFCNPAIATSTDTAFSLPAAFSLLISRVEPGPKWASVADGDEGDEVYAYRYICRYDLANERSIELTTVEGTVVTGSVETASIVDMSTFGLNDEGVVAKFIRLVPDRLRHAVTDALDRLDSAPQTDATEFFASLDETVRRLLS